MINKKNKNTNREIIEGTINQESVNTKVVIIKNKKRT